MGLKYELILALKKEKINREWRARNSHNYTTAKNILPVDKVTVGNGTYGSLDVEAYGNTRAHLSIGHYCSIARDVRFVLDGGHSLENASLFPFKVYLGEEAGEATTKGPIVVHDDVWIAERCLILSGVDIGQGAVIGAGSVVTKDVPPYAVFAGGRIIKYRFAPKVIEQMMKFDYSRVTSEDIRQYRSNFYLSGEEFLKTELYKKYSN